MKHYIVYSIFQKNNLEYINRDYFDDMNQAVRFALALWNTWDKRYSYVEIRDQWADQTHFNAKYTQTNA